jgi:hypothetical protein
VSVSKKLFFNRTGPGYTLRMQYYLVTVLDVSDTGGHDHHTVQIHTAYRSNRHGDRETL